MSGADPKARRRKAEAMQMFYRVRSVLLSDGGAALTLVPVEWGKDSPTETITENGETFPAWEPCDPSEDGAESIDVGGAMTELRFHGDSPWKPGAMLRVNVDWVVTAKS